MATTRASIMLLRIRSITYLATRINGYEFVDPDGHDPAERGRYCIGVLREADGRGSRQLHEEVRVGDLVEGSMPRNNFPLAPKAERHLLIAGGIGITPIMAMIAELR